MSDVFLWSFFVTPFIPEVFLDIASSAAKVSDQRRFWCSGSRRPNPRKSPLGHNSKRHCNCKNSRCLKLYCECFASGRYCSDCNCVSCCNNQENEKYRQAAVEAILERNPNAFRPKIQVRPSALLHLCYLLCWLPALDHVHDGKLWTCIAQSFHHMPWQSNFWLNCSNRHSFLSHCIQWPVYLQYELSQGLSICISLVRPTLSHASDWKFTSRSSML